MFAVALQSAHTHLSFSCFSNFQKAVFIYHYYYSFSCIVYFSRLPPQGVVSQPVDL